MLELVHLLAVNMKRQTYIGLIIKIQRVLHLDSHIQVLALLEMELLTDMGIERLVYELAVKQRDTLEGSGSVAVFARIMMDEGCVFAMITHLVIHIRKIAAYHIQHLVMGQTLLKILIKPLADLLFEWVVQVKKCFGHEVPLYYKSYLHKNACFYARYNCR